MTDTNKEWNSQVYHRVSNPQFGWGLKVLDRVELRGDERVMDAGCGSGRLTAKLLERLPNGSVVGVDLSRNMLDQAAEHLRGFNGRVQLMQAELTHLPFHEEFDLVFSTACFHWVLDHPALFASLYRALKPTGRIEAQCGGHGNLENLHGRTLALMNSPKYVRFFQGWKHPWEFATPDVTVHRLRDAGFIDAEAWLEPAGFRLNTEEEYRDFLDTVILRPFLNSITDENLRTEFLGDMVRQAVEDPAFELDYVRLNLRATKG